MAVNGRFKRYFIRGLAALLPTIVTIWILIWGYRFIQNNIGRHINRGIVELIVFLQGEGGLSREMLHRIWITGPGSIAGFVFALAAVFIFGVLLASVIGKTLWRQFEKSIMNTPVLRRVYPYIKQVTDFVLAEKRLSFSRVVAVEYPRKGIWSLGLVTGSGLEKVSEKEQKEFLSVLIPTSPTPFTGFVIMVPKEDVIDLNITVEQAIRFTVSAGVIVPGPATSARLDGSSPTG